MANIVNLLLALDEVVEAIPGLVDEKHVEELHKFRDALRMIHELNIGR